MSPSEKNAKQELGLCDSRSTVVALGPNPIQKITAQRQCRRYLNFLFSCTNLHCPQITINIQLGGRGYWTSQPQ